MKDAKCRDDRHAAGFTLIEVLVAFTIGAITLGAMYEIFATGMRSSAASQHLREASLIAESSLDALTGVPVAAGETSDRVGRYGRRAVIRPRVDLLPNGTRLGVIPYEINIQVSWLDGARQRDVTVSTIWLGPSSGSLVRDRP